jgi:hypothetical protein
MYSLTGADVLVHKAGNIPVSEKFCNGILVQSLEA